MFASGLKHYPRDRCGDERRVIDGHFKPPVLRRSSVRAICAAYLLLIVYGTLGPFQFAAGPWLAPADTWHWFPPAHPLCLSRYNDLFTNLLVYIPVGVALVLLLRRRGGARSAELLMAMYLSVILSYATELLQQFMPGRTCDRADLIVNAGAALFGCLIAPFLQRTVRRGHELAFWHWRSHPWLVLAWGGTGSTFLLMTVPWDLTWPSLEVQWDRPFDLLDFRRFAAFTILGFLISMAMVERLGVGARAVGEAIKRVFVCAVFFEAAQILFKSHACGLLDISTCFAGGLAGAGAARWLTGMEVAERGVPSGVRRPLAMLTLLGLVAAVLITGLSRVNLPGVDPYGPDMLWLPFQVQFLKPFDRVLTSAIESLFLYASLTVLCLYLIGGRGRAVALLLLLGLVGLVQLIQMHFLRGVGDVTPLLLASVAWLVTVRCWKALRPQPSPVQNDSPAGAAPAVT